MKVEIRPIEKEKWHGKKGIESFTQPKVIEALLNVSTGRLETGLTDEEAIDYGKRLNVNLSSAISMDGTPHPFYGSKQGWLVLPNSTIILDTDNPLDYIKIKLAKASKSVANSLRELEEGLYPHATHVIYDEVEEVQKKASKINVRNKAIQIAMKMTTEEKANVIQIINGKSAKTKSIDFIDVEISDIIENKPTEFLRIAEMGKEQVYNRAIILEGIQKNVLTKEGNSIYYMGDLLGYDYESVVEYFANPQNQKIKVAVLEKIQNT